MNAFKNALENRVNCLLLWPSYKGLFKRELCSFGKHYPVYHKELPFNSTLSNTKHLQFNNLVLVKLWCILHHLYSCTHAYNTMYSRQYLQIVCLAEDDFIIVSQTKMHNSYLPWLKRTFLKYNFNFHPFIPSYCLHNACFKRQWREEIFPWKHRSEKQFKFSWTKLISDFSKTKSSFYTDESFSKVYCKSCVTLVCDYTWHN